MSGHVGDLSPQQEEALQQLKDAVKDVHRPKYDDYYYLRWLRARNFVVSKAETMMRKSLAFRKSIGADTILTDYKPPELVHKYYPRGYLGPDKEGCPVRLMPFTNLDLKGFVYSVRKGEIIKFLTYLFEQDIEEMDVISLQKGKVIERHSYIIDLDGYTFQQATNRDALGMLNDVLKMYEANYPERMKIAYFVNAPTYFNVILSLSKPFLSDATVQKFKVFGKDFRRALLADMDAEILPKYLGGTRTDPDGNPKCETIINYGAKIPTEYYAVNCKPPSIMNEEGVQIIKVSNQSREDVEIQVEQANTRLEWIIETVSKDIAFGLYFKKSQTSQTCEELIAMERISCHLVSESGAFTCEIPGIYILRFCNTYSWITSKKVFYKYNLIRPEELQHDREN